MTVLVAAASEHGATDEIAFWLGAALAQDGVDVDVRRLEEVSEVEGYDAFVLGSAVYFGQWLKPARSFVEAHAGELARKPTWLFSSGPIVGDPPPPDDPAAVQAALVERLVETTHARDHKVFGGKLDKSNLNWCEKIAVRCAHASEGDHRDRAAVDEWAATIARELEQLAPQSRRFHDPHRVHAHPTQ
jgi:menaquinone-dependent protoporphyrinogen oxidase